MMVCQESKNYYEMQSENIKKRMDKLEKFKRKTYDNYMDDLITREEYVKYVSEYEIEIKELTQQQAIIQNKSDLQQELDEQYDEWIDAFQNYVNIKKLTRDVVLELIDKIEVHKDKSITIYYKFNNPYAD